MLCNKYEFAVQSMQKRFSKIKTDILDHDRANRMETCLNAILEDINMIKHENSMLKYPASTVNSKTWTDKWLWDEETDVSRL